MNDVQLMLSNGKPTPEIVEHIKKKIDFMENPGDYYRVRWQYDPKDKKMSVQVEKEEEENNIEEKAEED
jgi:hypothetical protein